MTKRPLDPGDFSEEEQRFARRLRTARRLTKTSLDALSNSTGVAKYYISRIENLKANPSLLTCARLARGLGRDLGDLTTSRPVDDLDTDDST